MHGLLLSPDTYALRDSFCPYTDRFADNSDSGFLLYERMREHCTAVYLRVLTQRSFHLRRGGSGLAAALQAWLSNTDRWSELNVFRELLGCPANKELTRQIRRRVRDEDDNICMTAEPLVRAVLELLQEEVLRRNPGAPVKPFAANRTVQPKVINIASRQHRKAGKWTLSGNVLFPLFESRTPALAR